MKLQGHRMRIKMLPTKREVITVSSTKNKFTYHYQVLALLVPEWLRKG